MKKYIFCQPTWADPDLSHTNGSDAEWCHVHEECSYASCCWVTCVVPFVVGVWHHWLLTPTPKLRPSRHLKEKLFFRNMKISPWIILDNINLLKIKAWQTDRLTFTLFMSVSDWTNDVIITCMCEYKYVLYIPVWQLEFALCRLVPEEVFSYPVNTVSLFSHVTAVLLSTVIKPGIKIVDEICLCLINYILYTTITNYAWFWLNISAKSGH